MNEPQPKTFPAPVDWDELYPGRFIKAGELQGKKLTLRILKVALDELVGEKGAKIKGIVTFARDDERAAKEFALNKTNGFCLREMFGRKVQAWLGKRVTLFPTVIETGQFKGKDCIRVWGSPDIAADIEVTIVMPRKRPVVMTMHRMLPKGASAAAASPSQGDAPTAEAPIEAEALAKVRSAKTLDALSDARKTVWGLYAAANAEVPLPVEIAANDRREALQSSVEPE